MKGVRQIFLGIRWGEKSMFMLYLSVLSGLVVALQYNPAEPLYSTATIDLLVPFGAFWRSLHFYSSQLFFLLCATHLVAIMVDRWQRPLPLDKWLPLIASLPVIVLLLFTGYVLRGDVTGDMAGRIAENILLAIPVVGHWLNELLFSVSNEGVVRVYVNHLIGLGILWGWLSWDHLRRYKVGLSNSGALAVAVLVLSLAVAAPMEPEQLGVFHITGPWFFVGLQELLRYVPPFWAGVVFPMIILLALVGLADDNHRIRRRFVLYALLWLSLYAFLTAVGFYRG